MDHKACQTVGLFVAREKIILSDNTLFHNCRPTVHYAPQGLQRVGHFCG